MEFGTIEREVHIDAAPEIVFQVVSSPEHLREWWPDEARYEPVPGSVGEIVFGDPAAGGGVAACTGDPRAGGGVGSFPGVAVEPPRRFAFRWTHPADEVAGEGNSLMVTFDLVA